MDLNFRREFFLGFGLLERGLLDDFGRIFLLRLQRSQLVAFGETTLHYRKPYFPQKPTLYISFCRAVCEFLLDDVLVYYKKRLYSRLV